MAVVGAIFMMFILFFPRGIWGSLIARWERRPGSVTESGRTLESVRP
jgi:hypothetical protein